MPIECANAQWKSLTVMLVLVGVYQEACTTVGYMDYNTKIYVAGHRGLVGSAIIRQLKSQGHHTIITRMHSSKDREPALSSASAVYFLPLRIARLQCNCVKYLSLKQLFGSLSL